MTGNNTLTARHYIQAGLYHTRGEYSNLGAFLDYISNDYSVPFSYEGALTVTNAVLSENYSISGDDNTRALRRLIRDDIAKLRSVIDQPSMRKQIGIEADIEKCLRMTLEQAMMLLAAEGLEIDPPNLFFVDEYPAPFEGRFAFAMALDEDDQIAYGCTPGLYFKKYSLRPVYSRYLLLHELVHVLISRDRSQMLAGGLEEGLCEILGSFYLSSKIFGWKFTVNMFGLNRHYAASDEHFRVYIDYTRQASVLLRLVGWKGIFDIVKKGRRATREVEALLWKGEFNEVDLTPGRWPTDEERVNIDLCVDVFSNRLICSPLAKLLSRYANQGQTVRELAREADLSSESVVRGLNELESKFNLVSLRPDKSVLTFSDCFITRIDPMALRYEVDLPQEK